MTPSTSPPRRRARSMSSRRSSIRSTRCVRRSPFILACVPSIHSSGFAMRGGGSGQARASDRVLCLLGLEPRRRDAETVATLSVRILGLGVVVQGNREGGGEREREAGREWLPYVSSDSRCRVSRRVFDRSFCTRRVVVLTRWESPWVSHVPISQMSWSRD